jgi:hypothetical protein
MEAALADPGVALVLDLPPTMGVQLAAEVIERRLAHVVLVLPRWPHTHAVLPCEALVQTLIATAPGDTEPLNPNVVFVLDGERQRSLSDRPPGDAHIDNRYALSASDLPPLARLRSAGIRRLVKVTSAPV